MSSEGRGTKSSKIFVETQTVVHPHSKGKHMSNNHLFWYLDSLVYFEIVLNSCQQR